MAPWAVEPVRVLLNTYLFRDLPPAQVERLAAQLRPEVFESGAYVCRTGDPADALYIVASGQLKELILTEDGEELVLEIYTAGGVLGEPGLFASERNRIVDVVAMQRSVILTIGRQSLLEFLFKNPVGMLRMLEGLATQIRSSCEDLASIAFRQIRERVVLKLLELAETQGESDARGVKIRLRLSQATLADMIASSRENVNRALSTLISEGELEIQATEFVIIDPYRLTNRVTGGWPLLYRRNRRTGPPARR